MYILLFTLWILKTVFSIPHSTYYWQLKEYRWDRMREFILQQGGASVFYSFFDISLLLLVLLSSAIVYLFQHEGFFFLYFPHLVAIIFLAHITQFLHLLFQRLIKKPRFTTKALLILFLTFVSQLLILYFFSSSLGDNLSVFSFALILSLLSLFEHDVNAVLVFFLNTVSSPLKRRTFNKAAEKRKKMKDLKVIGITGSYGKTSVKEFLSHLLEGSFRVLKTDKNTNTEMGIAKTILSKLKPEHEVFVCEMGAYKIGEIQICSLMAQPRMALFTGLNDQHVALFGSIDKTFEAKWELPSSLPATGFFIANGDAPELKRRLRPLPCETIISSLYEGETRIDDFQVFSDSFSFRYKGHEFSAPLVGAFHAQNVLMSLIAAEKLGVPLQTLVERVKTLQPPDKTLEISRHKNLTFLDDSYNVNTDGLKVALEHLKYFPETQKILFFPGILELGEDASAVHLELGETIAEHVDHAFFFDPNFSSELLQGALKGGLTRSHVHLETTFEEQIAVLKELLLPGKPTLFLFESRGAERVFEWLRSR